MSISDSIEALEDAMPKFNWVAHYGIFVTIACICMLLAMSASLWLIFKHLRYYHDARLQKHIIRIILMVPMYAFDSFLSLVWADASIYIDMFRDCYEAYVLYQFFALLVEFINHHPYSLEDELGEEALAIAMRAREEGEPVVAILEAKEPQAHPFPLRYILPRYQPGRSWLRHVRRMILQYVLLKPLLSLVAVALEVADVYDEGSLAPWHGYIYVTLAANLSVSVSMYYLVVFYHVVGEELRPLNPLPKFLCIKTVILFAFWQSVAIAVLAKIGIIGLAVDEIDSDFDWVTRGLNDFLICVEMVPIAFAHAYAFGYSSFKHRKTRMRDWIPCFTLWCCPCSMLYICCNCGHVVAQGDVISDSADVFGLHHLRRKVSEALSDPATVNRPSNPFSLNDQDDDDDMYNLNPQATTP